MDKQAFKPDTLDEKNWRDHETMPHYATSPGRAN